MGFVEVLGGKVPWPPAPGSEAVIIQIADAVADLLEVASLYQSFSVIRAYVPVADLADLADMRVTVVPTGITSAALNRNGLRQYDYMIDVGIQRMQAPTNPLFDPSMLVAQQVVDMFRGKPLVGYEDAQCVTAENAPVFDPAHADQRQVFTSVVSLTFRLVR